jgi:hypothetical protein
MIVVLVLFERKQSEAVGVVEVPLAAGEDEEQERAHGQHQAHEHLQT